MVNHGSGDAELLIVQTALKAAKDYRAVLIGEDTDLLVLALHYFTNEKALYFTYEPKQSQQLAEVWNISHAKQILGKICHGILVIHAFSGWDRTSRIHSVGKPAVLEKYRKSNQFQKLTTIFLDSSANKGYMIVAGEQFMLSITRATKKEKTMDEKHLANYYKKLGRKPAVKPESLGPTSDATAKHSERIDHTVQNSCRNDLPPEQWDGNCRMGFAYLCK